MGLDVSTHFIEVRMNIEQIKENVLEIFKKHNLTLYSIKTKVEYQEHILEILIDADRMTYELLEPIHMEVLDSINDLLPDHYLLELSTVGIERPLRSLEEVSKQAGNYVYLETDGSKIEGTLKEVHGDMLVIQHYEKGKPRKSEISYDKITFIRKAVKF